MQMNDTLSFLKNIISISGLSGYEAPVREKIRSAWEPYTDEIHVSRMGSLHGLRHGTGTQPRNSILLAAHMDAIGLMVTGVVEGYLRLTEIGGIDPRVLPGTAVTVHGRQELKGVIVSPNRNLLPDVLESKAVPLEYLLVDVGMPPEFVNENIRVGDLISFDQPPVSVGKDLLLGHSLDNRASIAALSGSLSLLDGRQCEWDVWAVATVQEEETFAGAYTSAFKLRPSIAVAIDVTHGAGPGVPEHKTCAFGEGPVLGWGPNIHQELHKAMKRLAEELEIPHEMEPLPRHSGTDAYAMQVTASGIPTMVVSIPLRYMHTPIELVSVRDIERCSRLMAEFICSLDGEFMEKLALDKEL
jgi:endoglucanase